MWTFVNIFFLCVSLCLVSAKWRALHRLPILPIEKVEFISIIMVINIAVNVFPTGGCDR